MNTQAKNLILCRFLESAAGRCPLHACPYANSVEETAANEAKAREKKAAKVARRRVQQQPGDEAFSVTGERRADALVVFWAAAAEDM